MELDDQNLPVSANDWLLASSDQVRAMVMQWQLDPESASVGDVAATLIALAEAQARIIAKLDLRIQELEEG